MLNVNFSISLQDDYLPYDAQKQLMAFDSLSHLPANTKHSIFYYIYDLLGLFIVVKLV